MFCTIKLCSCAQAHISLLSMPACHEEINHIASAPTTMMATAPVEDFACITRKSGNGVTRLPKGKHDEVDYVIVDSTKNSRPFVAAGRSVGGNARIAKIFEIGPASLAFVFPCQIRAIMIGLI